MTNNQQAARELLPCPFCGGEAEYENEVCPGFCEWIACKECGCGTAKIRWANDEELRSAWNRRTVAREWLPIESAPKDGTRVLLVFSFGGSERIECGRYDPQKFNSKPRPLWVGDALSTFGVSWYRERQPTRWQPLPAPPRPTPPDSGENR